MMSQGLLIPSQSHLTCFLSLLVEYEVSSSFEVGSRTAFYVLGSFYAPAHAYDPLVAPISNSSQHWLTPAS